ncbi:DUF2971 domain-containing protein [Arthrobacter sp. TMS2-4]
MTESPFRALNPDGTPRNAEMLVYHYTNGAGALGIASSGLIWATNARFLNDSTEIHSSFSHAAGLLESKYRPDHADLKEGLDQFVNYVREAGKISPNIFIACFSEAPDLLSQWRGYGGAGGQAALGFNVEELRQLAVARGWRLERCIYDRAATYVVMTRLLESVIQAFITRHRDTSEAGRAQILFNMIYSTVLHASPTMKHHSFSEEKEWRLISPVISAGAGAEVKFRPGRDSLVPYMEFELPREGDRLRIPHYYVGPGPHKALATEGLSMLFSVKDVSVEATSISQIPFLP